MKEAGRTVREQVRKAVWLALSREPEKDEMAIALSLLARNAGKHAREPAPGSKESPAHAALVDLCRMLLNVNEFVYVD